MCFHAFVKLTRVGKNFLRKVLRHVMQGLGVPVDRRTLRSARDTPASDHARAFFTFLYQNLAEPLAETDLTKDDLDEEPAVLLDEWHDFIEGVSWHDSDGPVACVAQGASVEPRQGWIVQSSRGCVYVRVCAGGWRPLHRPSSMRHTRRCTVMQLRQRPCSERFT